MTLRTLAIFGLCAALGVGAGMLMPHLSQLPQLWAQEKGLRADAELTLPEKGLTMDAFALRLFQAELTAAPDAAAVVAAPAAMEQTLTLLREVTAGKTAEQIDALKLPEEIAAAHTFCGLLVDTELEQAEKDPGDAVLRLPFRTNMPEALSLLNMLLNEQGAAPLGTEHISQDTRLLALSGTVCKLPWLVPFDSVNTRRADFDNANGAMPVVPLMRARGLFRTAEAEDGSAKALALLLNDGEYSPSEPLALVIIVPMGNARRYAEELTAERLSDLRSKLVQAGPSDTLTEIPRLNLNLAPRNAARLLETLGVPDIFRARQADFSPLLREKIALNGLEELISMDAAENSDTKEKKADLEQAERTFTVDKPFLWYLGELNSSRPPLLMGLVENL